MEEIHKYAFKNELIRMAASCVGLKANTARTKAAKLFEKYIELISYTKEERERYKNLYDISKKINKVLKSGKIHYSKGESVSGVLILKDIEQVEFREKDVLFITKAGREIVMGSDFFYLKEIFE